MMVINFMSGIRKYYYHLKTKTSFYKKLDNEESFFAYTNNFYLASINSVEHIFQIEFMQILKSKWSKVSVREQSNTFKNFI